MGNLIKETPYSEITATLEVLQSYGVSREHLELIRKDPARASVVAQTMIGGYVMVDHPEKSPTWREENGIIRICSPVVSDGTTGEGWINRLESKGFHVGPYAKSVLRSDKFTPTSGVTTEVAVLKGTLFTDDERITKNVRAKAGKLKLGNPNAEVACLIRELLTDEELKAMGLYWIVVMHEPIEDSDGVPNLLCADRCDDGRWLNVDYGWPGGGWHRGCGFAFAVSPQ